MLTIQLIELASGEQSPHDGQYVQAYDPAYHPEGEEYDGGLLLTTSNKTEARQFSTAGEAFEYWRQSYGTRTDGKPNRPLTA